MSSDDDFIALRRFDRLHCRILLRLQDQASELESRLDSVDVRLSKRSSPDIDNGCVRSDTEERKELLEQAHKKLSEYGGLNHTISREMMDTNITRRAPLALLLPEVETTRLKNGHQQHPNLALQQKQPHPP